MWASSLAFLSLGSECFVLGVRRMPHKKWNKEDRGAQSNEDQPVNLKYRNRLDWINVYGKSDIILCFIE